MRFSGRVPVVVLVFAAGCVRSWSEPAATPAGVPEAAETAETAEKGAEREATRPGWMGSTVEPVATWPVGRGPDALHLDEASGQAGRPPRPVGLVTSPDGSRLFVVAPQENKVYPVRADDGSIGVPLPTAAGPDGVGVTEDPATDQAGGRLFVASFESGFVLTFDLETGAPLPLRYRTGTKPIGVVVHGARLYVSNYGADTVGAYNLEPTE